MAWRAEEIKRNGLTYHFTTRVRPDSAEQLPNNVVSSRADQDKNGEPVIFTHYDSILDTDEKSHQGWWGIYSIINHKVECNFPEYSY